MPRLRIPLPRLPLHHLHRAFPELDGYTDEQCLRFIRASRGSVPIRFLRGAAISFLTLIVTVATFGGVISINGYLIHSSSTLAPGSPRLTWYGILFNIAIIGVACAAPPICAFLARDFFLIRRVRRILRTRGTCVSCRYTLVGLAVAPDLKVICPECGHITEVDPALGELTTDEAGRPRFRPDESRHQKSHFWTDARRKRLKRTLPWIAVTIIGLPLLLAGSYEGFLRWQASVAQRDRTGHETLNEAMIAFAHRNARPSDPNAWNAFDIATARRYAVDDRAWRTKSEGVWPDFGLIYSTPRRDPDLEADDEELAREQAARELALELVDLYRDEGVYDTLDELAASPLTLRLLEVSGSAPLFDVPLSHLGEARVLASICAARAHLAARAGDREEFLSALESGLALARLLHSRAFMMERLVAGVIENLMLDRLNDTISRPIPDDWIEPIHAVLERQLLGEPDRDWIEYERICTLDSVAWIFSDPSRVRFGRWTPYLAQYHQNRWNEAEPLGTYRRNVRAFNAAYDEIASYVATPIPQRDSRFAFRSSIEDLLLVEPFFPGFRHAINAHERRVAIRRATRALIAIERYRIARGRYPVALADLVPDFMPSVPLDSWANAPLCYLRIDSVSDPHGRGYILYSVGADFADNGGTSPEPRFRHDSLSIFHTNQAQGVDYIFNEPISPD